MNMTPIEKWSGRKSLVGHLRMFGCVARAHIPFDYRKKMDAKGHACIMMGHHSQESKFHRSFYLVKRYIIIKRNVVLHAKTLGINLLNSYVV